ncbi:acyloxyacyl hydrolase [Sphingomonas floccifaciens]|uniref:Acyloxyacyl hydrolase n=1 Tax=Sphingomonas floccifaciens TaxID=1844115 RepID=A0ABW4NG30_9SPHN
MIVFKRALCATAALASIPAMAQDSGGADVGLGVYRHGANLHPLGDQLIVDAPPPGVFYADSGAEIGVGVLAHGAQVPIKPKAPPGQFYGRTLEGGTTDIQLIYRSRPLPFALKPRLTAKAEVNLSGLTSFAAVGAEWRQHVLKNRVYGQIGIGLAIHDGYTAIPDPFDFTPGSADFMRRYDLYSSRTDFGSRIVFNPNLSVGIRIDRAWAVEATWEHLSHGRMFGPTNDGIDNLGVRLIRTLGRK